MSDILKKKSESRNNKSYYDPPYNMKYHGNGLWSDRKNKKSKKKDVYYDPKYSGSYYGNGLYGPELDETEKNFQNGSNFIWMMLLVILCASPYK